MSEENNFQEVIRSICLKDKRYKEASYYFLRQALDYTVRQAAEKRKKKPSPNGHHVSGVQLLEGIREFALNQFGPLTINVLEHWGITQCEDFGEIVFNLVETGVLGKTENDKREDFASIYDFREAFLVPFYPKGTNHS